MDRITIHVQPVLVLLPAAKILLYFCLNSREHSFVISVFLVLKSALSVTWIWSHRDRNFGFGILPKIATKSVLQTWWRLQTQQDLVIPSRGWLWDPNTVFLEKLPHAGTLHQCASHCLCSRRNYRLKYFFHSFDTAQGILYWSLHRPGWLL